MYYFDSQRCSENIYVFYSAFWINYLGKLVRMGSLRKGSLKAGMTMVLFLLFVFAFMQTIYVFWL